MNQDETTETVAPESVDAVEQPASLLKAVAMVTGIVTIATVMALGTGLSVPSAADVKASRASVDIPALAVSELEKRIAGKPTNLPRPVSPVPRQASAGGCCSGHEDAPHACASGS